MTCVDLDWPGVGPDTVTDVELQLGMIHPWVGDLVVKVRSPSGTLVTVLSRPGNDEMLDDGAPPDNSNGGQLFSDGVISFDDGAPTDAETMGAAGGIVCIDDGLCDYDPNPGAAAPGNLSLFVGEAAHGTWQVCVGDAQPQDVGSIESVQLTIAETP